MDKILEGVVTNADKLGTVASLVLFIVGMSWALITEKLVTGPRYQEVKETAKQSAAALVEANKELDAVKDQLTRLQVEKELLWQKATRGTRP
jgi:hypothetical protein